MVFYNDHDRFVCAWLRNLIADGHLTEGPVDERSILDLDPAELRSFRQCHFFAGIGGWPYALHLAEWPRDREVWTGSCPCQPLSGAGQRKGHADERHLWPAFYRLIAECRPATIFGEQVASKDGREWLAGVRADLEALGYAVGAADLCAASAGAPHIRQRLFWVADAGRTSDELGRRFGDVPSSAEGSQSQAWERQRRRDAAANSGATGGLAVSQCQQYNRGRGEELRPEFTNRGWQDAIWLPCLDGKARRIEPGIQPLADGFPNRVGLLRGAGNAIVPQVAAEFVRAFMEV